ncbi:MAG: hypothetical protein WCH46_06750 [bacterium]
MNRVILIPIVLAVVFFAGCYNDTVEELYGLPGQNVTCDTSGVSYNNTISAKSISTIISNNCASCHTKATAHANGGDIVLDNLSDLVVQAKNGKLMADLNQTTGSFVPMPFGGNKLDACTIAKVQHWINIGMPQN